MPDFCDASVEQIRRIRPSVRSITETTLILTLRGPAYLSPVTSGAGIPSRHWAAIHESERHAGAVVSDAAVRRLRDVQVIQGTTLRLTWEVIEDQLAMVPRGQVRDMRKGTTRPEVTGTEREDVVAPSDEVAENFVAAWRARTSPWPEDEVRRRFAALEIS